MCLTRGWCLRERRPTLRWRRSAPPQWRGSCLPAAQQAIDDPSFRRSGTDPETIATRTDKWDPATETSRAQRSTRTWQKGRREVLAQRQRRLDELIGLEGPRQIAV